MHDLFMSYSRSNRKFVAKLASDLKESRVDIWLNAIDLQVGDSFHLAIEEAIRDSRFFCIAISPAALSSYYVRRVEFEQAFTRLAHEQRETYILPILVQKIKEPLPPRLAQLHFLDFTKRKNYIENMRSLARKVRLRDASFTGHRWYKGLEISTFGEPTGVIEISQMSPMGNSYCISWADGVVTGVDVFLNGEKNQLQTLWL